MRMMYVLHYFKLRQFNAMVTNTFGKMEVLCHVMLCSWVSTFKRFETLYHDSVSHPKRVDPSVTPL